MIRGGGEGGAKKQARKSGRSKVDAGHVTGRDTPGQGKD